MTHIIKRRGQKQKFDERKLYASVFAACLSAHTHKEEAEIVASLVCREIKKWIDKKEEIGSDELFKQTAEELAHLNKNAAYMYKSHRDIA